MVLKCSIFTDDMEVKIYQDKSISSLLVQLINQRCAQYLLMFFNLIQSILLWEVVVSLVVRGPGFVICLQSADSRTDWEVKQA